LPHHVAGILFAEPRERQGSLARDSTGKRHKVNFSGTEAAVFVAGSSFWILPETIPHLWFVISDPTQDSDRLLIVNLTSYDASERPGPTNDPACVLAAGEHSFVRRSTCVAYYFAQLASDQFLMHRLGQKTIRMDAPADSPLLTKMRERAGDSRFMTNEHYQVLTDQNLA
jgi:hypothetical protein